MMHKTLSSKIFTSVPRNWPPKRWRLVFPLRLPFDPEVELEIPRLASISDEKNRKVVCSSACVKGRLKLLRQCFLAGHAFCAAVAA